MVTLVPALSAASMVATVTMALSAVVVKLGLPATLVSTPLVMVTLLGSSSHMPPKPFGADASATCVTYSMRLPEVSMAPPLPLSSPPRATALPCIRVVSLAQTTMVPPLPRWPALAYSVAVLAM